MRFGTKLQSSIYEPWKDSYLNYSKLKNLLYEGQSGEEWGERDESRFVEELDSELEKAKYIVQLRLILDLCVPAWHQSTIGEPHKRAREGSGGLFQSVEVRSPS